MTRGSRFLPDGVVLRNDNGRSINPVQMIMPIALAEGSSDRLHPIGTCFPLFAAQNVFVTARHVLADLPLVVENDELGTIRFRDDFKLVGGCYTSADDSGKLGWMLRPIIRLWEHPTADLALGLFARINLIKLRRELVDHIATRDFSIPTVDDLLCTFAYPNLGGAATSAELARRVRMTRTIRMGFVNQVYPTGRDRYLLPEACMETSLDIRGGMSGGPVFNPRGRLCGVNSTSIDGPPSDEAVSFVSLLAPCLEMRLPDTVRGTTHSVRELIDRGF